MQRTNWWLPEGSGVGGVDEKGEEIKNYERSLHLNGRGKTGWDRDK